MAPKYLRIVLLGRGGAGKSTLARRIGEITGAPVIILDDIWKPGWTKDDVPEFRALVEEAHAGDRWVSDGNFAAATFDIRIPRATLIVWVERSRLSCSWRALMRVFKPGESHQIGGLFKVFQFIWRFDRINRPLIEKHRLANAPDVPVIHLHGDRDTEEFLAEVASSD